MMKLFVVMGSLFAFAGVAIGAFGAHALNLSDKWKGIYETGVQYHLIHALGLVLIGILAGRLSNSGFLQWGGWLMAVGIVLFSGSLYLMSITKVSVLGAITPIGGVAFLVSWLLIVVAVIKS